MSEYNYEEFDKLVKMLDDAKIPYKLDNDDPDNDFYKRTDYAPVKRLLYGACPEKQVLYVCNANFDMKLAKRQMMNSTYDISISSMHIKDVIFNDPATIVFWSDGTKTVCTCSEADTYDPEKGLALCCMKKLLYKNKGHIFNNARAKWLKKAKK